MTKIYTYLRLIIRQVMPKFLAVHPVGKEFGVEAAALLGKKAKSLCTLDAQWIKSWCTSEEGKLYCECNAKDAQSIRAVFAQIPELPVEGVYQIQMFDSEDFK